MFAKKKTPEATIEAPVDEVATREAALEKARAALSAAKNAEEQARTRHYEAPDDDEVAKRALRAARDATADAAEAVGKAEYHVGRAQKAKEEAAQAANIEKRGTLFQELSYDAVRTVATPLAVKYAAAILQLANVQAERVAASAALGVKVEDLRNTMTALGLEPSEFRVSPAGGVTCREGQHLHFLDGLSLVFEALQPELAKMPNGDPRQAFIRDLVQAMPALISRG